MAKTVDHHDLSPALESYVEAVYDLRAQQGLVRVSDVARFMQVKVPSAHGALRQLKVRGYVHQEPYGAVELTEAGRERAKGLAKKHGLLERFLIEVVGVDMTTAQRDACAMEHCLSEETTRKLTEYFKRTQI
jgi:DtxR family Mn-dependent transcriptional regulator